MARARYLNFYRRYLELLARRSTIYSGWNHIHAEYEHGDLSAKGYVSTQAKVQKKVDRIREMEPTISATENNIGDMLSGLELFDSLDEADLASLEKSATCIHFLPGDTIMGAYETGDNFYILIAGEAAVWRTDALSYPHRVADLGDGDIMGESALLAEYERGRHVRSATIKAETPCTLLRISMRRMLAIVNSYPDIRDSIQQIHDARGADHAPSISDA